MKKIMLAIVTLLAAVSATAQTMVTVGAQPRIQRGMEQTRTAQPKAVAPRKVEGLSSLQRPVGYWPTDSITLSDVAFEASGTYPLGAFITNNMLRHYAGCKVVGVRFAVGESIGRTRAFIYKVDADGNIQGDPVTQYQRTYAGWNNVLFNAGKEFELDGTESLIVGYDYVETDEMVAAGHGAICTVGMEADEADEGQLSGYEFVVYGNYGYGEKWNSVTNTGMLCAQLILDVSSMPAKSVSMTYLDTGFRYKQTGEDIELLAGALNTGREAVSDYELYVQIDDLTPQIIPSEKTLGEGATAYVEYTVRLADDIAVGAHTLRVGVKSIEGEAVEANDQTVMEQQFYVYAHPLQRKMVYVEQFTDQDSYLAYFQNTDFNAVLKDLPEMCLVNIYKPGNPLAISESAYLNDAYAYTLPCFTSNRAYYPGEEYIAYDFNYYYESLGSQISQIVQGIMYDIVAQDVASAAFATIELTPTYDPDTRELTVDVSGTLSEDALPIYGDVAVTLMLTEDKVTSYQYYVNARNRLTRNNNYAHNNVLRAYLTAPTGDKVTVSGDSYSARFAITLTDDWKKDNLKVVGVVTRYADSVSDDNVMEMDVTNADAVWVKDAVVSGIHELENAEADGLAADGTAAPLYNLSGQRVGNPYRGIVVRQGKKFLAR